MLGESLALLVCSSFVYKTTRDSVLGGSTAPNFNPCLFILHNDFLSVKGIYLLSEASAATWSWWIPIKFVLEE